jgi:lipopolysaccharide biosynthesis regulator YciM
MEIEFWWLLIFPVVFALGWFAARLDQKQALAEAKAMPNSYFKGVNFLLSEQPDRAVDAFLEAAQLDPETAELHFALANLFRKRGEIDRAIRLHQFLQERSDLSDAQRNQATYELGVDFLRAGILDRAEAAFQRLAGTGMAAKAARQLLELYELEKEWGKAIAQAEHLKAMGAPIPSRDLAHFYCEQAEASSQAGQIDEAAALLRRALDCQPDNVRCSLLLGELALNRGDLDAAIEQWRSAERQNPWYLPLVGEHLWKAYERKGDVEGGLKALEEYCTQYPSIDLLKVWFQALLDHRGAEEAYLRFRNEVRRMPSLLGLDRLLEAQLTQTQDDEKVQDLLLIRELMSRHTNRLARFRCHACGFQAKKFYWQCPGCAKWDAMIPRRVEELDFYPIPERSA